LAINVNISKKIFNDVYIPYLETNTRFEIFYGGAGSGKSKFIAQKKIYQHLKDKRKTLIVRKVGKTSRHSTFSEINQVISEWNLSKLFKVNKSDMEIKSPKGSFIFTGLDDVEKLKSISGITDIWIEEANELTEEDLEQLNLRLRGKSDTLMQITLSFNPISALHWLKKRFFDVKQEDCTILKTTYKDNRFLDQNYIDQIEGLKNRDKVFYEIYALGNWGILGNLVFTNYEVKEFDNNAFNKHYVGLDWGYNDPAALVKVAYHDKELWICDEFYHTELTNTELMEQLTDYSTYYITADSSEPARIKEFNQNGYIMASAIKGKDSIKFGIDFIRRHKINIHPSCINFLNEIQQYSYEKDKNGNTLETPIDMNNHLIDALRYAIEQLTRKSSINWLK